MAIVPLGALAELGTVAAQALQDLAYALKDSKISQQGQEWIRDRMDYLHATITRDFESMKVLEEKYGWDQEAMIAQLEYLEKKHNSGATIWDSAINGLYNFALGDKASMYWDLGKEFANIAAGYANEKKWTPEQLSAFKMDMQLAKMFGFKTDVKAYRLFRENLERQKAEAETRHILEQVKNFNKPVTSSSSDEWLQQQGETDEEFESRIEQLASNYTNPFVTPVNTTSGNVTFGPDNTTITTTAGVNSTNTTIPIETDDADGDDANAGKTKVPKHAWEWLIQPGETVAQHNERRQRWFNKGYWVRMSGGGLEGTDGVSPWGSKRDKKMRIRAGWESLKDEDAEAHMKRLDFYRMQGYFINKKNEIEHTTDAVRIALQEQKEREENEEKDLGEIIDDGTSSDWDLRDDDSAETKTAIHYHRYMLATRTAWNKRTTETTDEYVNRIKGLNQRGYWNVDGKTVYRGRANHGVGPGGRAKKAAPENENKEQKSTGQGGGGGTQREAGEQGVRAAVPQGHSDLFGGRFSNPTQSGDGASAQTPIIADAEKREREREQINALRPFFPVMGTDALEDDEEDDELKMQNLMMGQAKPANWPLGNVDNPFWVDNLANEGYRYMGPLDPMPILYQGGSLIDGATLYGSHLRAPTKRVRTNLEFTNKRLRIH